MITTKVGYYIKTRFFLCSSLYSSRRQRESNKKKNGKIGDKQGHHREEKNRTKKRHDMTHQPKKLLSLLWQWYKTIQANKLSYPASLCA